MLKLLYNVKCGFKELFITEKNLEEDLTSWIEIFNNGMLDCAEEALITKVKSYIINVNNKN